MYPNCALVVCGDLNRLNAQLFENNFSRKKIVRVPSRKSITLDLFLTNLQAHYQDPVGFPPFSISGHNRVVALPKIRENSLKTNKVVLRRDLRASGKAELGCYLGSMDWSVPFSIVQNYEEKLNFKKWLELPFTF